MPVAEDVLPDVVPEEMTFPYSSVSAVVPEEMTFPYSSVSAVVPEEMTFQYSSVSVVYDFSLIRAAFLPFSTSSLVSSSS